MIGEWVAGLSQAGKAYFILMLSHCRARDAKNGVSENDCAPLLQPFLCSNY
jgi:hypothetical protein